MSVRNLSQYAAYPVVPLPVSDLILQVWYGVENVGNVAGRVAVKCNLIEKKRFGDDTWIRYTPLTNDETASEGPDFGSQRHGPGIIRDKIWSDTNHQFRTRISPAGNNILVYPGQVFTFNPNIPGPPLATLLIPGAGEGRVMREWWEDRRGNTMKVATWLYEVDDVGRMVRQLDYQAEAYTFEFGEEFAVSLTVNGVPIGIRRISSTRKWEAR